MIVKFRRIFLHPWVAIVIVRRALYSFTQGELTRESRRRMAGINAIFDNTIDPESGNFANPYVKMPKYMLEKIQARNDELVKKFQENAIFQESYTPLPHPSLSVKFDFLPEDLRVIENAVEAYAKNSQVTRDVDRGFDAVFEAIEKAETVEVDTEQSLKIVRDA